MKIKLKQKLIYREWEDGLEPRKKIHTLCVSSPLSSSPPTLFLLPSIIVSVQFKPVSRIHRRLN